MVFVAGTASVARGCSILDRHYLPLNVNVSRRRYKRAIVAFNRMTVNLYAIDLFVQLEPSFAVHSMAAITARET